MSILTLHSSNKNPDRIVEDFKQKIGNQPPSLLIFFASSHLPVADISKALTSTYPRSAIAGCSTSGEIISGAMLKDSIVAMSMDSSVIDDVAVELISDLKTKIDISKAFSGFEKHFGLPMKNMDLKKYVGMVLIDGLSGAEERLIEKIGDQTDITFIGGSAGDDLAFKQTLVSANGTTISNGAVLILMKLKNGFDIIKTQSFTSTGNKLIATKVNEATRTVLEFNNKPATEAYSSMLGIPENACSSNFTKNPVGLILGNEPYVRSPQKTDNKNIVFYCNIRQGMELDILESGDIIGDTRKAINEKMKSNANIKGIINFNCILRTLELEQKNITDAYGKLFASIPTIGFSTYGEAYIGHINQTATMLVLT